METVKEIVLTIAGAAWTCLVVALECVAFLVTLVAQCFLFFLVGFGVGRMMGDD